MVSASCWQNCVCYSSASHNTPVLGLLVNPTMMSVYIPKPAQRTEYQYVVVNRDVRDLEMVPDTIDIVFGHLTSGKNPSMDKQIVNHDLKEQANTR